MPNPNRCPSCSKKIGIQIPGRCSECPNGTSQQMVKLCQSCCKGRCEVCKTPMSSPPAESSVQFGAGPTGFGGC